MKPLQNLCVFCGSSEGNNKKHLQAAEKLGRIMAESNITLVYGGGRYGVMGQLARSVLEANGKVIGIIPEHLKLRETAFNDITVLETVPNMHVRKNRMYEISDAFCTLPGGFGSLDETFEIITWKQIGLHKKPIVFANIDGYWSPVRELAENIIGNGFATEEDRNVFSFADSVEDIIPTIKKQL